MRPHASRHQENAGDIIGGLILTTLGAVWAATSIDYGLIGEGGRLAPGTVPFAVGVLLALCGLAIAVKAVAKGRVSTLARTDDAVDLGGTAGAEQAAAVANPVAGSKAPSARLRALPRQNPVLSVYLLVTIGILIMPVTGFSVAFGLAIFAILFMVERLPVRLSATIAGATALFGYLLFEVIFNLPLPEPFAF